MDAQLESLVELYLTRGGKVFVSPQYDVAYDAEMLDGGACPDFVALDMSAREVVIVEVTSSANLKALYGKINDRESRWFNPVRRRMLTDGVINESWSIRFLGFVRRDLTDAASAHFNGAADVRFVAIEDAAFAFAYWSDRASGLPR